MRASMCAPVGEDRLKVALSLPRVTVRETETTGDGDGGGGGLELLQGLGLDAGQFFAGLTVSIEDLRSCIGLRVSVTNHS